ncbi:MAG: CaiB/BaiF CoA-transferase family protein [Chloroflexota bacterium]
MKGALEGIRVLDLSWTLPGPYGSLILADMGADVIRIEEPHPKVVRGSRETMGMTESTTAFDMVNRNKRSIGLNLKMEEARKVFYKLAEKADVVLESFRPGVTKRLGVDYETISKINPRIVYCSVSAYGQDGPYRDKPGWDPNVIATAGVVHIMGNPDEGRFVLPAVPMADIGTGGMQAAIGILCALMAREKIGKGQYVDSAMLDGIVSWVGARHGMRYFGEGVQPKPGERPAHVYKCKDGRYVLVSGFAHPAFYENTCKALGLTQWPPHDFVALVEKPSEIVPLFTEAFKKRTRDEWLEIFSKIDSCVSPVNNLDQAFSDPQVLHRKMLLEIDHPRVGKVRQAGVALKLSDTPGGFRFFAAMRGQNTEEVLLEAGYSKKDLEEMRKTGAIS